MLSKKRRYDAIAGFEKGHVSAADSGEILEGVVAEVVKGGVHRSTNGVQVFIPGISGHRLSRNDSSGRSAEKAGPDLRSWK